MRSLLLSLFQARYSKSLEDRTASLDRSSRNALADEIERTVLLPQSRSSPTLTRALSSETSITSTPAAPPTFGTSDADAQQTMADLDDALEEARRQLARFEENGRFVGSRLNTYRRKLQEQRCKFSLRRSSTDLHQKGASEQEEEGCAERHSPCSHQARRSPTGEKGEFSPLSGASDCSPTPSITEDEERERRKCDVMESDLEKVELIYQDVQDGISRVRLRVQTLEEKREDILRKSEECREFVLAAARADEEEEKEREFDDRALVEVGHDEGVIVTVKHEDADVV